MSRFVVYSSEAGEELAMQAMNLTTLDEAELLGAMAMQSQATERARAAWGELYTRHRRYVYAVVSRAPCPSTLAAVEPSVLNQDSQ